MSKKEKNNKNTFKILITILIIIDLITVLVMFYIYQMHLSVIHSFIGGILLFTIVGFLFFYLPSRYHDKKDILVNQNFKVDIISQSDPSSHYRITENNLFFSYIPCERFLYVFPRFLLKLTFHPIFYHTYTYKISNKKQLSQDKVNQILQLIRELPSSPMNNWKVVCPNTIKYITYADLMKISNIIHSKQKKD